MSKRILSQQEILERIYALKPFKSHSWGTFTADDGRNVIDTVHIDQQLKAYEKLLETAEFTGFKERLIYKTVSTKDYRKGYQAGYMAGRRKKPEAQL